MKKTFLFLLLISFVGKGMAQNSVREIKNVDLLQQTPMGKRIQELKLSVGLYGYNPFISSISDYFEAVISPALGGAETGSGYKGFLNLGLFVKF